ncbi:MAG TPA: NADP-dependent oxidoreductase [Polyangia bacterium]|nr:NADP-dependent oxidoreductase [Polyangia bacterium]
MKTMQIDRFGGPEVLHAAEAPEPHAGRGQVRVRVRAIGVNRFDAAVRAGALEAMFPTPLPAVLGIELAGVVDEVGAGVSELAAGDEVFGLANRGAYAELAVTTLAVEKPKELSWELAASLAVAGETAARVLDALAVERGETLLVHGGAGAVGRVAVQWARLRGAQVIATGSAANQALIASLGATPVVYGDGLVARVRALGTRVDAVFDAAGKGALPDSIELRGGKTRIITIADPAARQLGIPFSSGTPEMGKVAALRTVAELAASGKLTVAVAEVLPLAEAARAHALVEQSHAPGKIVLTV